MSSNKGRINIAGLTLTVVSTLISLVLSELAFRYYYHLNQGQVGNLEAQLERSRRESLEQVGSSFKMGGLVQPSTFDDIIFELKPGISGTFQGRPLSINSLGMRDREHPVEKPTGVYRIVGIGDSVMFGWGVRSEDTYLTTLEQKLNQNIKGGKKFETLNFGVPGYNTTMEVATLEHKAIRFDPDLIILHFVKNDFEVPLFMQKPEDLLTLRKSYLFEFISARIIGGTVGKELVGLDVGGLQGQRRWQVLDQYKYMVGPGGFKGAIGKLAALVQSKRIPVLIILGSASDDQRKLITKFAQKFDFHLVDVRPYVEKYMEQAGVPDSVSERNRLLQVAPTDPHPNPVGHQLYMTAIYDKIIELGFDK